MAQRTRKEHCIQHDISFSDLSPETNTCLEKEVRTAVYPSKRRDKYFYTAHPRGFSYLVSIKALGERLVPLSLVRTLHVVCIRKTQDDVVEQCRKRKRLEEVPNKEQLQHSSKHKTCYAISWETGRPWLSCKTDVDEDGTTHESMYCGLCTKWNSVGANGNQTWIDSGCKTCRLDKVKEHEHSPRHLEALKQSFEQLDMEDGTKKMDSKLHASIKSGLTILLFIIHHNLSLNLFGELIELCKKTDGETLYIFNATGNAKYTSADSDSEFLTIMSESVENVVTEKIKKSPTFGLMCDEACDVSVSKHLGMCVQIVDEGQAKVAFLNDLKIPNGTAETITSSIESELKTKGISVKQMSALTSDGASVFKGAKLGVGARLRLLNSELIANHCKDHRLALAVRDSFKSLKAIHKVDECLEAVHKYYKYSCIHTESLRVVQEGFKDPPLKIKQAKHHRWLSHDQAVASIVRCYRSIVADLENHAATKKDVPATALLKNFSSTLVIRTLLMLADVMPHLSSLSLLFQKQVVNLGNL
ncbi:uncharacterized protein LOC121383633 [Gigantopelta aegis]|uniref:uncharacterized protein LOC121383633 n=1 Tax=Gigantopelta aegis TaxID=1735272 RepID=UPI001B887CA6|nr:uncharacterized protein LOC121383633 [Gigantopelta aegis]